jgi:hypothetical protein
MELTALSTHLKRFSEAIFSIDGQCVSFSNTTRLLLFSSSIKGINCNLDSGTYCSGIAEFEREQENVLEPYLKMQSIFSVVWMALENFIDELNPSRSLGKNKHTGKNVTIGKINALCRYICNEKNAISSIQHYKEYLEIWKSLEEKFDDGYNKKKNLPKYINENGEGIFRVYCLRNHIFHGDFSGFYPENKKWNVYTEALEIGVRIILFTLQMAFMAVFKDASHMYSCWHNTILNLEDFDKDIDNVKVKRGLELLHLDIE